MIWWDWEVILLLFEWEGGGREGCIEKTGGNKHGVRKGGKDDDMTAPQR